MCIVIKRVDNILFVFNKNYNWIQMKNWYCVLKNNMILIR